MNVRGHEVVLSGTPRQERGVYAASVSAHAQGDLFTGPVKSLKRPRMRGRAPLLAFTLIEIMVTVALLSVIIIGLVAMFGQVRRAFLSSMAQVDVLESGRAATDLIARDLEQMAPCYTANGINFYVGTSQFYGNTWVAGGLPLPIQQLANPNDRWTNLIQELFFLAPAPPSNAVWTGIGYRLQVTDEQNGIGSLYRYRAGGLTATNLTLSNNVTGQVGAQGAFTANSFLANRIIDGVTHFRVLAYQTNGLLYPIQKNKFLIQVQQGGYYPGWEYNYAFYSNIVPAYVEVELGILEAAALERYRAFGPGTAAANNYLMNHPGAVHFFRQRIPIRCYDPSAPQ